MPSTAPDLVHVVVAVIENQNGAVLIAKRHEHLHQGGLWEFPGGKVEPGEEVLDALQRELHEELGLEMETAHPLIRTPYIYPDRKVLLDVWRVTAYKGKPHGAEGQRIEWAEKANFNRYEFPAANRPIITAAQLPSTYLITPEPGPDFLQQLESALRAGVTLLQFRAPELDVKSYLKLAREVMTLSHRYRAKVLLNGDVELLQQCDADGIHLNSRRLMKMEKRLVGEDKFLAASCHNLEELQQAEKIGVDFALLSPVKVTASHPDTIPMGWENFHTLSERCTIPLYALGGMSKDDLSDAWRNGAQGIAAIRALWGGDE